MSRRKPVSHQPMPSPPPEAAQGDLIQFAEERWIQCPLADCKWDTKLLYEDYPLRDIRTKRLLCSACTIRQGMGYVGREVNETFDEPTIFVVIFDYIVTFISALCFSLIAHTGLLWVGDGMWLVAIILGIVGGLVIGAASSQIAEGYAGAQVRFAAVIGVLIGTALAPTSYLFLAEQRFVFEIRLALNFEVLVCTLLMTATAFALFLQRNLPEK